MYKRQAIALTVCTGGAGAATLGAAIAGAGASATTIVMVNAAIIGMTSTMTGQLAGGASFDDAFAAGVKAGATSAFTAGVAYGASDAMGLNAQLDPSGNLVKDSAGNVQYATSSGTEYAKLSAFDKLGDSRYWTLTGANVTASGVASAANGGKFEQGAGISFVTNIASMVYHSCLLYTSRCV